MKTYSNKEMAGSLDPFLVPKISEEIQSFLYEKEKWPDKEKAGVSPDEIT